LESQIASQVGPLAVSMQIEPMPQSPEVCCRVAAGLQVELADPACWHTKLLTWLSSNSVQVPSAVPWELQAWPKPSLLQ
jgi:hypothetical protein